MDSPISNNSVSSVNPMSPQVRSPQPRRTPYPQSKKNNLTSVPFLDLLDDADDIQKDRSKTQNYLIEKLHQFSIDDIEEHRFEFSTASPKRSYGEIERKTILNCIKMLENPLENLRPPTRANNPQVNDQQFVKMDHEVRLFKPEKICLERVKNM